MNFSPNDGDINNNQMMNQNRKGYNSANKQGKTQKNNISGFNNDFLNNNKTLEKSNKTRGSKNKMLDFINKGIGNNNYMGSNYNYPINNGNHGYSNTDSNLNDIY